MLMPQTIVICAPSTHVDGKIGACLMSALQWHACVRLQVRAHVHALVCPCMRACFLLQPDGVMQEE